MMGTGTASATVRGRARLQHLLREVALAHGDNDLLDATVVAYRAARAGVVGWMVPGVSGSPSAEERVASWLIKANGGQRSRTLAGPCA